LRAPSSGVVPTWRRWAEPLAFVCCAVLTAWNLTHGPRSLSTHTLGFWISFLLVLSAWGLSFLQNRRFLALKICFVIAIVLDFRYFDIGFMGRDLPDLVFTFAVLLIASCLRPYWENWDSPRQPWWPAFRRTFRRFRGDWGEGEARFGEKILEDKNG
jgi:hypothetical protein